MEKDLRIKIPTEVYQFFTNPGGHSLIVRGNAGTGKTTFALQTIEELSAIEKSFYHSTRVSDMSLLTQFAWLKGKMEGIERTDSFADLHQSKPPEFKRIGLSNLKGIKSPPMEITKGGGLAISIGKDLGELEGLYRGIEKNLPDKSLVVIDSIDALAEKYSISCSKLLSTIQYDVVEGYGSNVLFVLENSSVDLDYLGDGVINFSCTEYNRRRLRELEILKLRGCEIGQPKYIFTLDGGRIQAFGYQRVKEFQTPKAKWKPIGDTNERVSSGITDLDATFGGLEKGSITLIELGQGVPTAVSSALETAMVSNFVAQGRGVLWVPLRKASAESSRSRIIQSVAADEFDRLVRIPEKADQMTSAGEPFILPIEGANAFSDFKWQNVEFSLNSAKKPLLSLMGFDTMQSLYGTDPCDQLMDFLALVRRNNGMFVALVPPSGNPNNRLADLATTRMKIERIGGTVLLYGEEPFTECYALHFEEREAGGNVSLTPIL
jgi:KaiC/GvpD/RAD55 family RecA-like ATPase